MRAPGAQLALDEESARARTWLVAAQRRARATGGLDTGAVDAVAKARLAATAARKAREAAEAADKRRAWLRMTDPTDAWKR